MRKLFMFLAFSLLQLSLAQEFEFVSSSLKFEGKLSNNYSLNEDTSLVLIEANINESFREVLKLKVVPNYVITGSDGVRRRFYNDSITIEFIDLPEGIVSSTGDRVTFPADDFTEMVLSGIPTQLGEAEINFNLTIATKTLLQDTETGIVQYSPYVFIDIPDSLLPNFRLKVVACTDPTACNYYSGTTPNDDKSSCVYATDLDACASCSGDTDGTGTIVDNDSDDDGVCDADESVGIDELREFELDLFPNPSDNKLFIRSNEFLEKMQVQVVNVTGKVERSLNLVNIQDNEPYELDLENLSPGLYMIKTSSETKTISLPWVKY